MGQVRNQGITGKVSREGLATFTVPYFVDTLDEALNAGDGAFLGIPLSERSFTERKGGEGHGFDCVVSYEGLEETKESGDQETYEWRGSFSKEPIETHPKINDLIATYGGRIGADGKVTWDPKLPEGSTAGTGEGLDLGEDAPETEKNPMYGNDTYLVLGAIFSRTRVVKDIPDDVLEQIGKIYSSIPWGNFPTPTGRDWLGMAPTISQRGNAFEISDNLMLSAPGGWPKPIHELITV